MRMLIFADIHIGNIKDTVYQYNVITSIIEKEIEFTKTDAVVILGDYFDRLFKANEEYVALAINIMSYLVRACAKNKTKIRIVYGTESHEMNQYRLFNHHFSSKRCDIKLFTTATEEELFPNVNVLYLPEEYIDDKHEFYKDTLYKNKYTYIFGHGNIIEGLPQNMALHMSESKSNEKKVPVFKSGELSSACTLCVFGHYHVHTKICDNVYYLGSLFRNCFGEEKPKGYGIIEDDKLKFIENKEAYTYKSYTYDSDDDIYNDSDSLIREIEKIKEENKEIFSGEKVGKIRLVFNMPKDIDETFKTNLHDIVFNDKMISTLVKQNVDDIIEDAKSAIDDEYEFVLDNSMNIVDKIHTFITKQYETDMTLDEIAEYIYEELKI